MVHDLRHDRHPVSGFFADGRLVRCSFDDMELVADAAVVAVTIHDLKETADRPLDGFERIGVPHFEHTLWLAHRGLMHVYPDPKRSFSAASGAIYLARSKEKSLGFLLQLLPPLARTSRHYHRTKMERFINLAGACVMGIHDREIDARHCDRVIRPFTPHYLRTEKHAAVNLLVISGHPDPLSMSDHHYIKFSSQS